LRLALLEHRESVDLVQSLTSDCSFVHHFVPDSKCDAPR
jgi:hypothetical protein